VFDFVGAQGRNRTTDTAIFNRMLYQLSYLGANLQTCPPTVSSQAERGRYRGSISHCPERPETPRKSGFNAQSRAEPLLEGDAVAQGQHAGRLCRLDQDAGEQGPTEALQVARQIGHARVVAHV
jgi:hypothetical protein